MIQGMENVILEGFAATDTTRFFLMFTRNNGNNWKEKHRTSNWTWGKQN